MGESEYMILPFKGTKKSQSPTNAEFVPKVYKRRWLILFLYCIYAISSLFQWALYSVIANVVGDYYNVSYALNQWTSLIGIVVYLIFSFPALYLLDKLGLKWSTIIGIVGTCVGSWIKVASVHPSRFWVLILGQGIVGTFRVLILPLPQKLASVWFGSNEVSRACGIAVLGTKISAIFGFLLPPLLVDGKTRGEIESGLYTLAYVVAIFPTIILPFIIIFFRESPPTPPSISQLNLQKESVTQISYKQSLKTLFFNKSFMVFLMIFGITSGMESPIYIVLNQILLKYHPGAEKDVGYIGVTITVFGLFGSYAFGYLLDNCRRYRLITIIIFVLNALSLIAFLSTMSFNLYFIYCTAAIAGFFITGIITIGYIIGAELTYPEPEDTTGGLLMIVSQIFGLAFTNLYTYLFMETTELVSTIVISSILVVTTSLFFFVKFDLRKQKIEKNRISL